LFIKAAWGNDGLYMLVEAKDDLFVGLVATGGGYQDMSENIPTETSAYKDAHMWMNDCFDMMMDIYSSTELTNHYIPNNLDYLTYSTYQYQYRFGSNEPAAQIRINYVDPTWKECNVNNCWTMIFGTFSMGEAEQKYKIRIETVNKGSNKAQEWFMPWTGIAAGIQKPSTGSRVAVTFQYNDMDALDGDGAELYDLDVLFFKNRQSILAHREPNQACGVSTPWGDIEFGGSLNDIIPPEGGVAVAPKFTAAGSDVLAGGHELFSAAGRKIPDGRAGKTAAIVIKRSIHPNSRSLCEKELVR
jgi:hypothetical protein